jgi:hypothetical protein
VNDGYAGFELGPPPPTDSQEGLAGIAPELLVPPPTALRATLHPRGKAQSMLNFTDEARACPRSES